jgi:hypothetical protein
LKDSQIVFVKQIGGNTLIAFENNRTFKFVTSTNPVKRLELEIICKVAEFLNSTLDEKEDAIDTLKKVSGVKLSSDYLNQICLKAGSTYWKCLPCSDFFLKMKKNVVLPSTLQEMLLRKKTNKYRASNAMLKLQYAHSSVLNELLIAPKVLDVIRDTITQNRVMELELPSLDVILPVGAFLLLGTPVKFMLYPFVQGLNVSVLDKFKLMLLCAYLEARFKNAGIASGDLNHTQFFLGEDNKLYLVDLEGYYRIFE